MVRQTGTVLQWYDTDQAQAARSSGQEIFLKEARKMTRVNRIPQVVQILDLFLENDTAYIIMDFIEGETLKQRLEKSGPLSWQETQNIFLPVIRAMEQVHQAGLIHRDLSPDNLMLLPEGGVMILDLGAAKDLNLNSGASSMQVAKGGFSRKNSLALSNWNPPCPERSPGSRSRKGRNNHSGEGTAKGIHGDKSGRWG